MASYDNGKKYHAHQLQVFEGTSGIDVKKVSYMHAHNSGRLL
jgi:hypothetical protein